MRAYTRFTTKGDFAEYAPISGTETPIYVGMAIYGAPEHHDPSLMGTSLSGRLEEHKKNIERASETLDIADFRLPRPCSAKRLGGSSGDLPDTDVPPLWNKEVRILQGFGKHGDSVTTRANKRSPWDTLHEGRNWASGEGQKDKKSLEQIRNEIKAHYEKTTVYSSFEDVFAAFVSGLKQTG